MRIALSSTASRKRESGIATVIMLILVGLISGFILANTMTLSALHNDVKRIEQRQIRRLSSTNATATAISPAAEPAK